jgi:7-cyano-7-deazaguanine synthase
MMEKEKAVVIFSGGQDSTTVLGYALQNGLECVALSFDYGQKHAIELEQAKKIATMLGVEHRILDVKSFGQLVGGKSALVDQSQSVSDQSPLEHMPAGIPASFVPNRNALFLTIAHGFAQTIGATLVLTGVCETDYSGYPDCRHEFVRALEDALNIGYLTKIEFITPLMWRTKADTFAMAEKAGVLDIVLEESHTCYNGVRNSGEGMSSADHDQITHAPGRHEWGHGCGECPACQLRAKGWEVYKAIKEAE